MSILVLALPGMCSCVATNSADGRVNLREGGGLAPEGAMARTHPPDPQCPRPRPGVAGLHDGGRCCGLEGPSPDIACGCSEGTFVWLCNRGLSLVVYVTWLGAPWLVSPCFSVELTPAPRLFPTELSRQRGSGPPTSPGSSASPQRHRRWGGRSSI